MSTKPSKILLIFCDGTGSDGNLTISEPGPTGGGSGKQRPTNVLRLSRAVKSYDSTDQRLQLVFYQSGVGSEATFSGDPVDSSIMLQALGTAVASKIRDAYAFISQNFQEGDEICVFGFSRGAYTARKLAGLIHKIGLLERQALGQFFEIWLQLINKQEPTIPVGTRRPRIKCVGVWDTVGSVYNTIDALSFADTDLQPTVDIALHALSLQENREKFLPTLWTIPKQGLGTGQILKQIWFPGAHSDVGGSYERHELADISLFWMAGEISSFINLDEGFLRLSAQQGPDPWGTSQPHNAYEETPAPEAWVIGNMNRLDSGAIVSSLVFHESVRVAPLNLDHPGHHMITLRTISNKFGSGWSPTFSPLNTFEESCKKAWSSHPFQGGSPIQLDHPSQLFPSSVNWEEQSLDP